jgi:hypothetical protein
MHVVNVAKERWLGIKYERLQTTLGGGKSTQLIEHSKHEEQQLAQERLSNKYTN